MENKTLPAPLHQVVGQLRELLKASGAMPWCVVPNDPNEVCEIRNSYNPDLSDPLVAESLWHADASLIVAAVNALPALLAIAEAAAVVSAQRNGPYLMADMDATMKAESDLRTALSLLPNTTNQQSNAAPIIDRSAP